MRPTRIAGSLLIAASLMTACSGSEEGGAGALSASTQIDAAAGISWAPAGPLLAAGQRSGDLMVWVSSSPDPPVEGDAQLETLLTDDSGEPVSGATVTYDLDMTNMSHGLYVVPADATQQGRYVGGVHLSMPGPWRVIVTIERPDRPATRLRFEFRVMS